MSKYRWKSFRNGSVFDAPALVRAGGEVASWIPSGSSTAGAITVTANRTTGIAPAGFFFTVSFDGWGSDLPNFEPWKDVHIRAFFDDYGVFRREATGDFPWDRVYLEDGTEVVMRGRYKYAADRKTPLGYEPTGVPTTGSVIYLGIDRCLGYGPWQHHAFCTDPLAEFDYGDPDKTFTIDFEARLGRTESPDATTDITVTVRNPLDLCANLYCVNSAGAAQGDEPTHPGLKFFTSYASAKAQAVSDNNTHKLFLMRRGETTPIGFGGAVGGAYTALGSYGSSSTPHKITVEMGNPDIGQPMGGDERTVFGLDFEGPYDPLVPDHPDYIDSDFTLGGLNDVPNGPTSSGSTADGRFSTLADLSVSGIRIGLGTPGNGNFANLSFFDVSVSSWQVYGAYFNNAPGFTGLKGVFLRQKTRIITGKSQSQHQGAGAPKTVDQGPFRTAHTSGPWAFDVVDMFTNGSWGVSAFQPAFRFIWGNALFDATVNEAMISRIRSDCGAVIDAGPGKTNDVGENNPFKACRLIYDKIQMLKASGQKAGGTVFPDATGLVVRNYYQTNTDMIPIPQDYGFAIPTDHGGYLMWNFGGGARNSEYSQDYLDAGIEEYNWTIINNAAQAKQQSELSDYFRGPAARHEPATLANSIFAFTQGSPALSNNASFLTEYGGGSYLYIPDGSAVAFDLLDMTSRWTPTLEGHQFIEDYLADEPFSTQHDMTAFPVPWAVPEPGSPFIGAEDSSSRRAVDDIDGNIRDQNCIGAVLPAPVE